MDMSDTSDLDEMLCEESVGDIPDEICEDDIEEITIDSDAEDCSNNTASVNSKKEKCIKQPDSMDAKMELELSYEILQMTLQKMKEPRKVKWKRTKTIQKAIQMCRQLVKEEGGLKVEVEELFQEYCMLRRRMENIERSRRKKKRKTQSSKPVTPQCISISTLKINLSPEKNGTLLNKELETHNHQQKTKPDEDKKRKSRCRSTRKSRNQSGLTEEEKELCELEERIDDLLHDVDSLWNEVKDDPEREADITDTNPGAGPCQDRNDSVQKLSASSLNTVEITFNNITDSRLRIKKDEGNKSFRIEPFSNQSASALNVEPEDKMDSKKMLPGLMKLPISSNKSYTANKKHLTVTKKSTLKQCDSNEVIVISGESDNE